MMTTRQWLVQLLLMGLAVMTALGAPRNAHSTPPDPPVNNVKPVVVGEIHAIAGVIQWRASAVAKPVTLTAASKLPMPLHPGEAVSVTKGNRVSMSLYGRTITLATDTFGWYPIPLMGSQHNQLMRKLIEKFVRTGGRPKGASQPLPLTKLLTTFGQRCLVIDISELTDAAERQHWRKALPPFMLTTMERDGCDLRLVPGGHTTPGWRVLRTDGSEAATIADNSNVESLGDICWQELCWRSLLELRNTQRTARIQLHLTLYQVEQDHAGVITTRTRLTMVDGRYVIADGALLLVEVTNSGQDDCVVELFDIDSAGAATSVWPLNTKLTNIVPADGRPHILGADAATGTPGALIQLCKTAAFDIIKIVAVSQQVGEAIAPDQWQTAEVMVHYIPDTAK